MIYGSKPYRTLKVNSVDPLLSSSLYRAVSFNAVDLSSLIFFVTKGKEESDDSDYYCILILFNNCGLGDFVIL